MFGRAKRVVFEGGRKKFVADSAEISRENKFVKRLVPKTSSYLPSYLGANAHAAGRHGRAFDLLVRKGTQERRLVVKKYRLEMYPKLATQSSIAAKEFRLFQKLKKKGYHVPPTIRLVKIGGKKYVAITDLTKIGKLLTSAPQLAEGLIGSREIEKVGGIFARETERAKKEFGIDIIDSWEFVVDTKKGKILPFILDLGFNSGGK